MTEDEKELQHIVRENLRIAQENNRLLRKLWSAHVTSFWLKILFYLLIIGVPVFVYQYYLQGYLSQLWNTYNTMRDAAERVQELPPLEELPAAVLQQFRGSQEGLNNR